MTDNINGKSLTWTGLIIRILLCYVVFAVASEIFFPFSAGFTGTTAEKLVWTAISYLSQFIPIYVFTALIAVSIAKIPVKNRSKPIQKFLNNALVATMLIAGIFIYGGWYSNQSQVSSPSSTTSDETRKEDFLIWIKTQSSESLAKSAAEELAKLLPMQINSLTLVYGVTSAGNTITMRVKALTTKSNFISLLRKDGDTLSTYITKFQNMIHNMGCTQKVNRLYIEQGVIYKYLVSDIDLNFLFEASVESCT